MGESGSPAPHLVWKKEGKEEQLSSEGGVLKISSVTRHQGGTYHCLADNGFGPQPVSKSVRLEVQYAPHISVEHPSIETGFGGAQELVCMVHSHPKAEVTWMRDGQPVDISADGLIVNSVKHRHSLSIMDISTEKLGQYQCKAVNSLGQAMNTV